MSHATLPPRERPPRSLAWGEAQAGSHAPDDDDGLTEEWLSEGWGEVIPEIIGH